METTNFETVQVIEHTPATEAPGQHAEALHSVGLGLGSLQEDRPAGVRRQVLAALANVKDRRALATATAQELTEHYALLSGLFTRYAVKAATDDRNSITNADMALKLQRAALKTLGALQTLGEGALLQQLHDVAGGVVEA